MSEDNSVSWPIRMTSKLADKIESAARELKISKQDTARLALAIGLEDLKRCNYEVDSTVLDAIERAKLIDAGVRMMEMSSINGGVEMDQKLAALRTLLGLDGTSKAKIPAADTAVILDEALSNQTARNRELIERSSEPPTLHALPPPQEPPSAAGADTPAKRRKKSGS